MSIGKKIKEARKKKGITQVQLADAAQISRSYLGDLEGDRYNPSVDTLQKIAAALGTTSGVLLGEASLTELIAADTGNKPLMAYYEMQRATDAIEKEKAPDPLSRRDERDIEKRLEALLDDLEGPRSDGLMFSGEPLDEETKELLAISLRNQLEMSKRIAKQKYTPKKHRKGD